MHLKVEGEDLLLEAAAPPPTTLVELLQQHKAEIIDLLSQEFPPWSIEDWQAFYDERAGIAEYDGGLPRDQAEMRAFDACLAEWLNQNSVGSSPNRCLHCGRPEHLADPLVPFGIEPVESAWLHDRCWEAWHAGRRDRAVAALAAMSITDTQSRPPARMDQHGGSALS